MVAMDPIGSHHVLYILNVWQNTSRVITSRNLIW